MPSSFACGITRSTHSLSSSLQDDWLDHDADVAGFDARDVEDFVDQFEEVLPRSCGCSPTISSASGDVSSISRIWANPSTELSGVRSSWLIRDMNSLLAALARSATSLASFNTSLGDRFRSRRARRARPGARGRCRRESVGPVFRCSVTVPST